MKIKIDKCQRFFVLVVFCGVLMMAHAYAQDKKVDQDLKTISGTVVKTDSVGNTISVRTSELKMYSFLVSEKAIITQQTHNIGLMDIGIADPVTIGYYATPGKYILVSIIDDAAVVND